MELIDRQWEAWYERDEPALPDYAEEAVNTLQQMQDIAVEQHGCTLVYEGSERSWTVSSWSLHGGYRAGSGRSIVGAVSNYIELADKREHEAR